MKTKISFLCVLLFTGLLTSCTPNALMGDNQAQENPVIYGTGGEHSAGPDNEKD